MLQRGSVSAILARPGWPTIGRGLLRTMRPRQWTKNVVLFLALFFSVNQYWSPANWPQFASKIGLAGLGFLVFCLVSSTVYLVNDLVDIEQDRAHPVKRRRPLAAGLLPVRVAVAAAPALALLGLGLGSLLGWRFLFATVAYVGLMVAYSFWLKHIVLVDVFTIAAGFVLRAVAGAVVIDVPVSPWLYLCTVLGALFLGFAKRRHELLLLNDSASQHRQILQEYSPQLLDQAIAVVTSSIVMAYSLYTFSAEGLPSNGAMMLTIPFVLYGIFRYLYLTHLKNEGGNPEEILLRDKPLVLDIALWLAFSVAILYIFRQI